MRKVDTLVVDKTGTLTEGKPRLVSVVAVDGFQEQDILRLAASLERGSEHPLAEAIVRGAQDREVSLSPTRDFESVTGKGVTGKVEGRAGRPDICVWYACIASVPEKTSTDGASRAEFE